MSAVTDAEKTEDPGDEGEPQPPTIPFAEGRGGLDDGEGPDIAGKLGLALVILVILAVQLALVCFGTRYADISETQRTLLRGTALGAMWGWTLMVFTQGESFQSVGCGCYGGAAVGLAAGGLYVWLG